MPNIGKILADQLVTAGIPDSATLIRMGSRQAFLAIRRLDATVCLSRLSALEGAIRGIRWHVLPAEVKAELKKFFASLPSS